MAFKVETEAPVIDEHSIDLMCRPFRDHPKGIAELLKNSHDGYERQGVPPEKRVIIINFKHASKDPGEIEVIDFVGLTSEEIEKYFRVWGSPDSASRGKVETVYGGHGTGGKCYMREMFDQAILFSLKDGLLNAYGFDPKTKRLGFIPDKERGKDQSGDNPAVRGIRRVMEDWAKPFVFTNVTIVRGIRPLEYDTKIPIQKVLARLNTNQQGRRVIQRADVRVCENGREIKKLELEPIPPKVGFEHPLVIPVPTKLTGDSGEIIVTANSKYGPGTLTLFTSEKNMPKTEYLRDQHIIDFIGKSGGSIGIKPISHLSLTHRTFADHIYGTCKLLILGDPERSYVKLERDELAEGPLTKALYVWIGEQVDALAKKFAEKERLQQEKKLRERLVKMSEFLNQWKDRFLEVRQGLTSTKGGKDLTKVKKPTTRVVTVKKGEISRIELSKVKMVLAKGGTYRLRPVGYNSKNERVRADGLIWKSSHPHIVRIDPGTGTFTGVTDGLATITTHAGAISSPPTIVQVVTISAVEIRNAATLPPLGIRKRYQLEPIVTLPSRKTMKDVSVNWVSSDENVLSVGRDGHVTGLSVGIAEVVAYAGSTKSAPAKLEVSEKGAGEDLRQGKGTALIKLSEIESDPLNIDDPVQFSKDDPPIIQRIDDVEYNVFWINTAVPLARELLKKGTESLQWRYYHFQRIIDVVTRIELSRLYEEDKEVSYAKLERKIDEIYADIYKKAHEDLAEFLTADEYELGVE